MLVHYCKFKNPHSGKTVVTYFKKESDMLRYFNKWSKVHSKTTFYRGKTELRFDSSIGVTIAGNALSYGRLVKYKERIIKRINRNKRN